MRRTNIISGVVLAVFGLVMLFAVIPWQIDPGPPGYMSPRLMPNLMMSFITLLSVLLVVTNMRATPTASETDVEPPISRAELVAFVWMTALFAVSIGLYLWVSPLLSAVVLVVGALLMLGERRSWMIVALPTALLLLLWLLFYKVLGTRIV
ncbi:tripartite tricarboxylate transporter TctB family protein [Mesorhizobium sp. BE184]|uniref:tripartite tricarboxylate transporter TctB family protein n=1 Tax=Mesorhizobium sp. BE184 TaxID=2817714 RepID=UPI00285B2190|nr:tripartite tricarboxylate transporter TctB family protein [Mesorhizobium sp. BE184]MDR7033867.1 hypothetical protein [Mesorhizobium sp. BE184]